MISSTFWFLSEDQSSKTSESTENRKEVDEASGTKSSSQIPAQPPVAKSPYGKGPPFNQVCWGCANSCYYQYFEVILQSKLEVLGKGRGYVVCRQEWDGDGSFVLFI